MGIAAIAGARPAHRRWPTTRPRSRSTPPTTRRTGAPRWPCSTWASRSPTASTSPERDSLYARAERLARRAVAADSTGADGHFAVAAAVGRASLTMGKKERIRRAKVVREEALRTIELDPSHDGAYHILGRWNAEIMRLSGFSRFFAKKLPRRRHLQRGVVGRGDREPGEGRRARPGTDLPPARAGPGLRRSQALRRGPSPAGARSRRCRTGSYGTPLYRARGDGSWPGGSRTRRR